VRKAAILRLAALVDPAIGRLAEVIKNSKHPDTVKAAIAVLDRTGYGPGQQITLDDKTTATTATLGLVDEIASKLASLATAGSSAGDTQRAN
jgi:hypothetical protein